MGKIFSDDKTIAVCSSFQRMAKGFLFFFWKFYTFREIFTYCKNSSPRGDNNSVDFEKKDDGWHFNSKKFEGNKISDEVLSNESKALFKACLKKR